MSLSFKTQREQDEYRELTSQNAKLLGLINDLVAYVDNMLHKDVVITSIHRTPEEEAVLYKDSDHKVVHSQHFTWEAVDLRSSIYTADEIRGITNYLQSQYKTVYVLYHMLPGNAYHFHIGLPR